ncbi:hypothetical protein ACTXJR_07915 [Glutamicibacter ardleyensis]|uniref:hypothetical protein n=1 Tax=Glutamicibacter ardleyensis TaxID=225894 RepID=UPI003F9A7EA3
MNQEGLEDEPLDGRDSQPVSEGSSDDPQTLDTEDPLRSDTAIAQDLSAAEPLAVATESPADIDQALRESSAHQPAAVPGEDPDQSGH